MEHYGFIKEDWSTGWSRRKMTCCGADCTKLTQWMIPKYCPWCGAKILEADIAKDGDF